MVTSDKGKERQCAQDLVDLLDEVSSWLPLEPLTSQWLTQFAEVY